MVASWRRSHIDEAVPGRVPDAGSRVSTSMAFSARPGPPAHTRLRSSSMTIGARTGLGYAMIVSVHFAETSTGADAAAVTAVDGVLEPDPFVEVAVIE